MSRWYFLALAAIPVVLNLLRPPPTQELVWWTTDGLHKVRPYEPVPTDAPQTIKIQAARNEFEPFQVILRAEGQDLDAVDVSVADLRGTTSVIPSETSISLYLEGYLDLKKPSNIEGSAGEWPDPLIPRIDRYAHEKRNAFPFKIARSRNQAIWVDVYVPTGTAPGIYHGEVLITVAGNRRSSIPLDLEVWNFDLPSTSTLPTTFGFSGMLGVRQHFGRYTTDKAVADLTSLYQKSALWHRITLNGSSGIPPGLSGSSGQVHIQWDEYDALMGPFLNGTIFSPGEPLHGAKATSVALSPPPSLKQAEEQIQYWREVAGHFRKKGWMDRLFVYLWDEPKPPQYSSLMDLGRTIRRADPALKNLVTAPLHDDWSDFVDIWTPTINCFERKPRYPTDYCTPAVDRAGYSTELARGKQLWWYQACNTHGCNTTGGDYFTGWPSYMIDHNGVKNRIMEWLTWKYHIGGELYFSTDEAFGHKSPWNDVYLYGGNGDGTLFYPGRPDVIGGTTNIPIESVRLKLIREGLEDYEYLTILTKLGGSKTATDAVNSFVRQTFDFDEKPEKLYSVRESLAHEIVRRLAN